MLRKTSVALLYLGIAALLYAYGDPMLAWLRESDHPLLVTLAATVLALFPVVPYPLVGGVIGAAFGPAAGAAIVWTGSTAASLIMFLLLRYGYRDWGQRLLNRYAGVAQVTRAFERNAFLAIMFARMLPFIPSVIVNAFSALSRVPFASYAVASALGKLPAMALFALLGDQFVGHPGHIPAIAAIYGAFLLASLGVYRLWQRSASGRPRGRSEGAERP
ncbi:TVP38/TMEM64 family protein [Cohnella hongkongensis]|uniref:TVP38/TMEM64 family membrane protein n=1 Tax=Cohnella hongkongensis TaxID=178337 RepID=A0ABV9F7N5_9BACL